MPSKKTTTSKTEVTQIAPERHIGVWQDYINPSLDDIDAIMEKYGFHELDKEAILEENQYARIDTYDDYLFLVLHFPKYDPNTERYIHNELNIFVGKDYLITFRYYQSTTMKRIYSKYDARVRSWEHITSAFLLYEIIESFLDKTMKMLERFGKDLKTLERDLWSARGTELIKSIMTRKRNIIALKHMMKPQIAVLKMIEIRMKERFSEEVELYFENLEDKLDKIFSEVQLLQENIDSMEDTLKSVFELQTNTTITYLTVFSAFILPLTLATWFFGMNIESLPFTDTTMWSTLWVLSFLLVIVTYVFIKKKII
jgi:magnesium transporter